MIPICRRAASSRVQEPPRLNTRAFVKSLQQNPNRYRHLTLANLGKYPETFRFIKLYLRCTETLQHLKLFHVMTPTEVSHIAHGLYGNQSVRYLDMSSGLDERHLGILFQALNERPVKLVELRLDNNRMGTAAARQLAGYLPSAAYALETLSLNNNILGDEGMQELCRGLVKTMGLRHLDLSNCRITTAGADILLSQLSRKAGEPMVINLRDNWIGPGLKDRYKQPHKVLLENNHPID